MKKKNGEDRTYVLDSSAFLTMFEDEDGADVVQELLEKAKREEIIIFTSFATFAEIFYVTFRELGEKEARNRVALMNELTISRAESTKELGIIAGRLKATKRISFADAWIAATAVFYDATLVHKDPEFQQLMDKIRVIELPYKKTA